MKGKWNELAGRGLWLWSERNGGKGRSERLALVKGKGSSTISVQRENLLSCMDLVAHSFVLCLACKTHAVVFEFNLCS